MSEMTKGYAVVVPVGPQSLEVVRLRDLIDSFAGNEAAPGTIILIDDSPAPRQLDQQVQAPSHLRIVSLHHAPPSRRNPKQGKGVSSAVMLGIRWVQANTDAPYVIKLDTDSLVIAPFHQRILERFASGPLTGMIGAHSVGPTGARRNWGVHVSLVQSLGSLVRWRAPMESLRGWRAPAQRRFRQLYRLAKANGYRDAEHCLGGGYALSRAAMDRIAAGGFLDDPMMWTTVDTPEDVLLAMHVGAVGMSCGDFVGEGEVFGTQYIGLPFPPPELEQRGYAIIHAVKNDKEWSEAEIRNYFKGRRGNAALGSRSRPSGA